LSLHRTDAGAYEILAQERIELIRDIPNHDDDGSPAMRWGTFLRLAANRLGVCCSYPREPPPLASTARASEPGDPVRGRTLFRDAGCVGCHAFAPAGSTAVTGPPLDSRSTLPPSYLEQAIVDPDAVITPGYPPARMPAEYGLSLSRQQLADLIAFIRAGANGG
jgi:mono/diheme cytochrome c family protein